MLKTNKSANQCTLGTLIDRYIQDREHILSPTTIQGYKQIHKNNFQLLMDVTVEKIDNTLLQRAINQEAMNTAPKLYQMLMA